MSGEEARIADVLAAVPAVSGVFGAGDDAAAMGETRGRRVVTTDAMVEGVHFLRGHPPAWLGWKLLAVNVSDVAAMGARPEGFLLTVALPEDLPRAYWLALCRGLGACARRYGVRVVGGDTVRSPGPLMLSVTAWGAAAGERLLTRAGGRAGDLVMALGPVGRAGVGLERWLARSGREGWAEDGEPDVDPCLRWQLRPEPDETAGPWALEHGATAGMDLSDGLLTDAPRLAAASGVTLDLELGRLPADEALAGVDAEVRAAGGEDYGLLVMVPPEREALFVQRGFVTLGRARAADPAGERVAWWRDGTRVTPQARPFTHFAESCHPPLPDLGSRP